MENTKEPCIICFEENQEKIFFDCNHSICLVCYSKLLQNDNATCPICRKKIDNFVQPVSVSIPIPEPIVIIEDRQREPEQREESNRRLRSFMNCMSLFCLLGAVTVLISISMKG